MEVSPHVPVRVPGATGVCTHLLGWGRGCICMRVCSFQQRSLLQHPHQAPPHPKSLCMEVAVGWQNQRDGWTCTCGAGVDERRDGDNGTVVCRCWL